MPLSFTFDTPGLLARSVSDLAYGFAALDPAGIDPFRLVARGGTRDLSGIRIGLGDAFLWRDCDTGIAETTPAKFSEAEFRADDPVSLISAKISLIVPI